MPPRATRLHRPSKTDDLGWVCENQLSARGAYSHLETPRGERHDSPEAADKVRCSRCWMFLNGMVALFLFASGMAYAVTTRRSCFVPLARAPRSGNSSCAIHGHPSACVHLALLPRIQPQDRCMGREFRKSSGCSSFKADVLHCIAVSLLFLQVILRDTSGISERRLYLWVQESRHFSPSSSLHGCGAWIGGSDTCAHCCHI